MKIISIPTEKFREQNPIFHLFYSRMRNWEVDASDFSVKRLISPNLKIFQIHFPEHFATNYSIIPAFLRSAGLIISLIVCKLRRIAIVWTVHNVVPFEMRNARLYGFLMSAVARAVDGCIFMSQTSQDAFRQRFPISRPRLTALIPHPAYPIVPDLKLPNVSLLLGMIGEQKPYKQPVAAVQLYETARRLIDCRLLIAGKVHNPDAFRLALGTIQPSAVEWLDRRLDDAELERTTKRADFILLPYSMVTNSGAALHALSCGRAIITSGLPLFLELRELFGPAWVRIADGSERNASFWRVPTSQDYCSLKRKLVEFSLDAIAAQHRAFFDRVLAQ